MSIFDKNNNAFDAIRLIAAVIVIYAHSYAIAPTPGASEFVARTTGVTHAGELSVVIFFFLSGALITKSITNAKSNIGMYFSKRILRIYPALILSSFMSAYLFSWTFGGANLNDIIHSKDALLYFIKNSIGVWNVHEIPNVYSSHPSKGLNGSLWSITLELRLYLIIGLLYIAGLMKTKISIILTFSFIIAAIAISSESVPIIGSEGLSYGNYSFPIFSCIFLIGGLFYVLESHFNINKYTVIIIFMMLVLCIGSHSTKFLIFAFTVVLCIWIATRPVVINLLKVKNDYSYGVYLYGWPSQQIAYSLIVAFAAPKPWQIMLIAIPLALLFAHISWVYVEKPCINLTRNKKSK